MWSNNTRFRFPNTLTFRLTLWYACAFVFFLSMAFTGLYLATNTILNERMDEDLLEDINEYNELFEFGGRERVLGEILREVKSGDQSEIFIRLLNHQGQILYSSDLTDWEGMNPIETVLDELNADPDSPILDTLELDRRESAARLITGYISSDLVLQVGESMHQKEELMELLLMVFLIMFCVVVPVASSVGWLMARQAVHGIAEVSKAAVEIKEGRLDRRVTVKDQRDEVQDLADTFNAMADRIRILISEMREMTDNIAHDLRSPLGRIRAISEQALSGNGDIAQYKKAAADTLEECDRLINMINTSLDVAEAEARIENVRKEEVDLSKLTSDACELFEPLAEEKHIDLALHLESGCKVVGDRQSLFRMLTNLLDNALKYTPSNGDVKIDLNKGPVSIQLSILDSGIGIPKSDQTRIFDRFYRCDQSRSQEGCGLGLSFARAVARAHGGDITLESEPAKRSRFTITLPKLVAT